MAVTQEPKLYFTVAGEKVNVDMNLMTGSVRDDLEEKVLDVRKKQSIYYKYEFLEGETNEKWSERVSKEVEEEYTRKEGESPEAHLKRMFASDNKNTVYDLFNCVAEVFPPRKAFELDVLKQQNWAQMRRFLYDVFTYCDIPANDLKPKELVGK